MAENEQLSSAEGFNDRGISYLQNNDYERAIADFTKALQLDPNYSIA